MRFKTTLCVVTAAVLCLTAPGRAAESPSPAEVVAPFLDNQTIVIGRVDVQAIPLSDMLDRAMTVLKEVLDDPGTRQNLQTGTAQLMGARETFVRAGGKEIYVVLSLRDIPYRQPFFIVTASSSDELNGLMELVGQMAGKGMAVRKAGDDRLLVGTAETLDRVQALDAIERPAFTAAWKAARPGPVQFVLAPSKDQHRALKETFPNYPQPWNEVTGAALSEGIQWAALTINGDPTLKAELLIESQNNEAAKRLRQTDCQLFGKCCRTISSQTDRSSRRTALCFDPATGHRATDFCRTDR